MREASSHTRRVRITESSAYRAMKIIPRSLRRFSASLGDSVARLLWLAVLGIGLVPAANASPTIVDDAAVEKFTGGHTRVVWLTDLENKDSFADRNGLQLMGYDSRDGKGERLIWGDRANYYRPLITPDGQQIVISNRQTRKIYVVNWDGSPPRLLKEPGCASEVWRDPNTGKTWVYYQEDPNDYAKPVLRFPIDEPDNVETVWSSSAIQACHPSNFPATAKWRRPHSRGQVPEWRSFPMSPGANIGTDAGRPWRPMTATSHGRSMACIEICS